MEEGKDVTRAEGEEVGKSDRLEAERIREMKRNSIWPDR